jgi:hypothetical protein
MTGDRQCAACHLPRKSKQEAAVWPLSVGRLEDPNQLVFS